jgi:hypothetical protein
MRFPRVAKTQPWAGIGQRFQRYSRITILKSWYRFYFLGKALVHSFWAHLLPGYSRVAALHYPLNFRQRGHRRISRCGHSQRAVRGPAFNCPLRALVH